MRFLRRLYGFVSLCLVGAGLVFWAVDSYKTDVEYYREYEREINYELREVIRSCEGTLRALSEASERKPFSWKERGYFVLGYDSLYRLRYWSDNFFIPSGKIFERGLGAAFLYQEKEKYFYVIPFRGRQEFLLGLIPLVVRYPIKNEYLGFYYFTGGRLNFLFSSIYQVARTRFQYGINYYGKDGELLLGVRLVDSEPLRYPYRMVVLILWALGAAAFLAFWMVLFPFPKWKAELLLSLGLILVRALSILFHFPYNYAPIPLFSSQILAINEWNPSLGDLCINLIVLTFIVYRWYRWFICRDTGWIVRLPRIVSFPFLIFLAWGSFQLFYSFFSLFHLIVENSLVYFEFTDIFELNVYSGLLVFNQSLALLILFFVLDGIAYVVIGLLGAIAFPFRYGVFYAFYFVALTVFYVLMIGEGDFFDFYHVGTLFFFVGLIFYLRLYERRRESLFSALLFITGLAAVMNLALSKSFERSTFANLEKIKRNFSNPRDLALEFTFNELVENITSDKSLFYALDSFSDSLRVRMLVRRLVTQYLIPSFKGYDFKVFVYDYHFNRIDGQGELEPIVAEKLEGTLSRYLKFAVNRRTFHEYVYLGEFNIFWEGFGVLRVKVEFYPKASLGQKLYPQLLLDESIKQRVKLPRGYEMGIYYRNVLINKIGNSVFPLYLNPNTFLQHLMRQDRYWVYYDKISEERSIVLKAPARTFFSKLTSFTVLFYIFSVIYFLIHLPSFWGRLRRVDFRRLYRSLAFRIQVYFLLISLLPIVIFSLFITPLFTNFFQAQVELELKEDVKQFAGHLENRLFENTVTPTEHFVNYELLNYYSDLLDVDINIFDRGGRIIATTLPGLFRSDIISEYMNPSVFYEFERGYQSEIIRKEQIGHLEYISAYVPLIDQNYRIVGFLNIPYLAKQDLLNLQIRQFLAYLINLYIVLILVTLLFGLFTSSAIAFPLKILGEKLRKLKLGGTNEPIEWFSRDEIGELILTYNEMVKQLSESERLLAKSEREGAWRVMARQVAHEIKNPLTPMKLSIQMLMNKVTYENPSYELVQKIGKTILSQIDALTRIANSFSDFAKMPEMSRQNISLNALLQELSLLYQFAEEAQVVVHPPEQEVVIYADKEQILRVLINLVKNALQAVRHEGKVEVRASVENQQVKIEVQDNGAGIPYDYQSKIFEPNFSTKTSGMGLGLAICKNIVEAHQGTISFVSKEGEGSTFFILLPLAGKDEALS